jgi:ELP3 family radical SAM enzyme/protein acetyltransferase
MNDIEDLALPHSTLHSATHSGVQEKRVNLKNPIITDLRVLEDRIRKIVNRDAIEELTDEKVVSFVKGLVYCTPRAAREPLLEYTTRKDYDDRVKILRRQYRCQPKKSLLFQYYRRMMIEKMVERNQSLEVFLRFKSARSHSGVLPVTVLTSPGVFSCPKDCHYCPDERSPSGEMVQPRSYLSSEPACRRADQNDFDPVLQFIDRCQTLHTIGHNVDKVENLVLGGTWSFYKEDYQEAFVRGLYFAANIFYDVLEGKPLREPLSLEEEQHINETGRCRIIGITLETRPDYITKTEIKRFRKYGCTRVQLGIQHIDPEILDRVNREHYVEHAIKAIRLLKENCFKVDGHFMPDLPGSSPEKDLEMFYRVIQGTDLQVDYMKIYPVDILPFTKIKEWYELPDNHPDKYRPYSEIDDGKHLINLIVQVCSWMKPWTRVNRIKRDFPNYNEETGEIGSIGGSMMTNLAQIVDQTLTERGKMCRCIRCREVKTKQFSWDQARLFIRTYRASGGVEYFISIESHDEHVLYGFVRLRFNGEGFEKKRLGPLNSEDANATNGGVRGVAGGVALIRELHVYGAIVKVNSSLGEGDERAQHSGIGKRLMAEAERIALDAGYSKIAVISGVGVRNYYRKLGYSLDPQFGYMLKDVRESSSYTFYIFYILLSIILFLVFFKEFIELFR